jgi:hypothetical protein
LAASVAIFSKMSLMNEFLQPHSSRPGQRRREREARGGERRQGGRRAARKMRT